MFTGKNKIIRKAGLCLAIALTFTSTMPANIALADTTRGISVVSGSGIEIVTPAPTEIPGPTTLPTPSEIPVPTTLPVPSDIPAPSIIPEPSVTPGEPDMNSPDATPAPDAGEITPTITPTEDPTPTETPTSTLTPTPTPEPTKVPYRSSTLKKMSTYDYAGKSVTGISTKKESVKNLQAKLKSFGTLYGTGMPYEEFRNAMSYEWQDATQYDKKTSKITVDITKSMDYNTYVNTLKQLSRYEGVYLYIIGKSTEGRNIYAVEIDMASKTNKNVIMLTGQIHAREFAGGTYIVKQLVDLVQKAQTDKKTMELLKKNKYVAVPIINVDGREAIIRSEKKWTTKSGQLYKAYTNGTDGGRNFPGLQWGLVAKGSKKKSYIASKPGYANYPGRYAGSNKETKAMMKWLYHYTVVEQAKIYLDMHQQGAIIYAGKGWQTKKQEQKSLDLRTNVLSVLNKGITNRKYRRVYESTSYGLNGEGSSLTDYAIGLSIGAKFSPAYGFSVFTDGKKEYSLLQVKDLDKKTVKVTEANKNFAALTLEIGYGVKYLGNTSATRRLLANEYSHYNFGKLLEALPGIIK